MPARLARIRDLGIAAAEELPRGLDASRSMLIESPEGTPLLLTDRSLE
jgi:hypothetical protein